MSAEGETQKKERPPKPGDIVIMPTGGFISEYTLTGFVGEVFFEVDGHVYSTFVNRHDVTVVKP